MNELNKKCSKIEYFSEDMYWHRQGCRFVKATQGKNGAIKL